MIVGVLLENDDKIYYVKTEIELNLNQTIVIEIEKGLYFSKVVSINESEKEIVGNVIRKTSKKDYNEYKKNQQSASQALKKCKELAIKYNMDINVIDATFSLNKDQLLFHFYSDERIDFRNLAKELASIYKTRIELRQIGVRDKAKKVGGYGSCGQKLCCARFLNDFDSISISMAKNQNISLNPNKINGLCGRLLCCLKYENECYKECRKILPKIGEVKEIDNKKGIIKSVNLIRKTYTIEFENGELIEVKQENGRN